MLDPGAVNWKRGLSRAWYEAAYSDLAACGYLVWAKKKLEELSTDDLDEEPEAETKGERVSYSARINDRILKAISFSCWQSLSTYVLEQKPVRIKLKNASTSEDSLARVQTALCRSIGVDGAQAGRWARGENEMDGNKVLGAITVGLRRNIQEIPFDSHGSLVSAAVRRTLGIIRQEECGGRFANISADELRCVRQIPLHPESDGLLLEPSTSLRDRILGDVLEQVRKQCSSIRSREDVRRAYVDWQKAYLYLRAARPKHLRFIDELTA